MGKLIIIEGTDGSGKQTQTELLYKKLCEIKGEENIKNNFHRLKELDKSLHEKDKTFFYTDFVVEKVIKYGNS